MTEKSLVAAEKRIGEWWKVLEESIKVAGQKERNIAISKGDTTKGFQPSHSSLMVAGARDATDIHTMQNQVWVS